VRAIDAAGNTDPAPAERTWIINTTGDVLPPDTAIDNGPGNGSVQSSGGASFTYHSTESGSTFACALDGASFSSCSSSGQSYSGLSDGSHTFLVRATDSAGNTDATPDERTWVVKSAGGGSSGPSSECDAAPHTTAFDGYVATAYAKLLAKQPDPQTTKVCFRLDGGSPAYVGGSLTISGGGASGGIPTTDTNSGACEASGHLSPIPDEHGNLAGSPYDIDTRVMSDEVWVCLDYLSVHERVIVPVPGVGIPQVIPATDNPPVAAPAPKPGPSGYPSAVCQNNAGPRLANADIGPTHLWWYAYQPSPSKIDLCVRAGDPSNASDPANVGGVLEVDATGSPGTLPLPQLVSNTSGCTFPVFSTSTPNFSLDASPPGAVPVSICVTVGSIVQRVTIDPGSGNLVPPTIRWTPDPGTPGGSQHIP
jgi:hypothetical protein